MNVKREIVASDKQVQKGLDALCVYVVGTVVCAVFFFFQAEDGIRDYKVTGVQTCALPISAILVSPLNGIFALRALISWLADLCILWQLNHRDAKGTVNDCTVTSQKLQCLIRDIPCSDRNFT